MYWFTKFGTFLVAFIMLTATGCTTEHTSGEKLLIGKWQLVEMSRLQVTADDTVLIRKIPVADNEYHRLILKMQGQTSSGTLRLSGAELSIELPYMNKAESRVSKTFDRENRSITASYTTNDSMLFITKFVQYDSVRKTN